MASTLIDACRFLATAGGTADFTFSAAATGYMSPTAAGATNGNLYSYRAESADLSQWEIGTGVYNSSTGVIARTRVLFNSSGTTSKISFTGAPQIALTALAEDLVNPVILQGYIAGLTLSTAGSSATFSVASGIATDSGSIDFITLASSISKTTSAWAVGTGNGALDTGAIAINTWYHAHLIKRIDTGVVDVLVSLSATTPTLPTNYTLARRIGSMKTNGSSQWTKFTQNGNEFLWDQAIQLDVSTATLTSPGSLFALTVPTGVQVNALLLAAVVKAAANIIVNVTSPDQADNTTFTLGYGVNTPSAGAIGFGTLSIRTNTSAQIRATSSSSGSTFQVTTAGWIDTRGASFSMSSPLVVGVVATPTVVPNTLSGLTLSTAGSSATFGIASGSASNSTNVDYLTLASAFTKTTSAWAVGTGNGALDTGAIANSTWYHVFLIKRPDSGLVDVLFSLSATAPTLPTSYTLFRRIGSMRTNSSSQWILFHQFNDEFLWDADDAGLAAFVSSVSISTTATLKTATVPTGIQVIAHIRTQLAASASNTILLISSPDQSDQAPAGVVTLQSASGVSSCGEQFVRTNTSGQIRFRTTTATSVYSTTAGWTDDRGKLS